MPKKKTHEQFKEQLLRVRPDIELLTPYINSATKILCREPSLRNPDVRFVQLLMNSGVITFDKDSIKDEHHVESAEILERMEK